MITRSKGFSNCGKKIHADFGENAFDKINTRGNYRIATLEYNSLTSELTINQYPDVSKTIILGEGNVSRNNTTSHKDTIEKILDWANMGMGDLNNLDKDKNYIIYNANNPIGERYLYYTYDKPKGEWGSFNLIDGDEFFNLEDSVKYRYTNDRIYNITDVMLSSRNTIIDGKSTGITLEVFPTTGDNVHLDLVGDQYAGLMSPEDKTKLDNLNTKIGSILELGLPSNGTIPLYLKTLNGDIISQVNLDEDDYINDIEATIATEDNPDKGIHIGDRVIVFTLTNGTKMVTSLEGWFLNYRGVKTESINLEVIDDTIKATILLDPSLDNLSEITSAGLLTSLNWQDSITRISSPVNFIKGIKSDYSESAHKGYIYFAVDSKEIIVDNIAYGLDLSSVDLITKIEMTPIVGEFLITKSNKDTYKVSISNSSSVSNGLMSKEDKIKLDTIEEHAQINKLDSIKIGNVIQPIVDKVATIDTYTKAEINSRVTDRIYYKGTTGSIGSISTEDRQVGDAWEITSEVLGLATNAVVYWNGSKWNTFTGTLDLSEYATKEDLNNQSSTDLNEINKKLESKVDKVTDSNLVSNDEIDKLLYLGDYVNSISESVIYGKINLGVTKHSPASKGTETVSQIILQEADSSHNGLLSTKHYNTLESLQTDGIYLDNTGTPNPTWQLSKNTGPKIKNSGGEFGLRNSTDDDYTGLTVKNLTITGNVTQLGGSFISEAQTVEVVDNTILLNKHEPGAGVTKGYAGIEIDRGTLPRYNIYFDESDDRFKAGQIGNEQPIMLRDEETNLVNGIPLIWDSTTKRAKSGKNIDVELSKYLPLTGGTLTGALNINSGTILATTIKGVSYPNADYTNVRLEGDIPGYGELFYFKSTGSSDDKHQIGLVLKDDADIMEAGFIIEIKGSEKNLKFNNKKVWHEENDGAGSGLDADLLDGKHSDEYALKTELLSNYVDVGSSQNITGRKSFIGGAYFSDSVVVPGGMLGKGASGTDSVFNGLFKFANNVYFQVLPASTNHTIELFNTTGSGLFTGNLTANGFYDSSDIRLKENITQVNLHNDKIQLHEFDKQGRHSYGVIAQEVEELYPSTVIIREDGYKTVNYNEILIIKCAELEAENNNLKNRLDKLEQLLIKKEIL